MKILHVITSLDEKTGGPAMALGGLAANLSSHGENVVVAACWERGKDVKNTARLQGTGVCVHQYGPARGPFKSVKGLRESIKSLVRESDIVHVHGLWEDIQHYSCVESHAAGIPFIIRPCGMLDPWSLSQGALKKKLYMHWRLNTHLSKANGFHATSSMEEGNLRRLRAGTPIIVEPNGLDLTEFAKLDGMTTPKFISDLTNGKPFVLFHGRIHRKKMPGMLIKAFSKVDSRDWLLLFSGGGDHVYINELKQMASHFGISDRVCFLGHVSGMDRLALLREAGLFALPSQQENFAIAAAEALACGTPVMVSDQVAIGADIRNGSVGDVLPLDQDRWIDMLNRRLLLEPWPGDVREKARHFARTRYDWESISKRWIKHYRGLLVK